MMDKIIERNMKLMSDEKCFHEIFSDDEIELIKNIKKIIQNHESIGNTVTVRFSGGYVRDKLLGGFSNDIDISIDGIDFISFTKELAQFYPTSSNIEIFRGIEKNKKKENKRISVAHIKLFSNLEIDICNIISDPLTDAKRRDLTINSLFYNINTLEIEDLVGGIYDLINHIIQTPDSIDIIFGADPLCFLRAFRFAARFGHTIQQEILNPSPQLLQRFKENVKNHPAARELMKMIKGNNIPQVFDWYVQANIFNLLFDPQNKMHLMYNRKRLEDALDRFDKISSNDFITNFISFNPINCKYISTLFAKNNFFNEKMVVVLSSIYFQNKDDILIPKTLGLSPEILVSVKKVISHTNEFIELTRKPLDKTCVGIWLRSIGPEWLLVRTILHNDELSFFDNIFVPFIFENKYENIFEIMPILNPFELGKLFGLDITIRINNEDKKAKKNLIDKWTVELIDWQINDPNGTAEDYEKLISNCI